MFVDCAVNARIARSQDRKIPGTLFGQPCDPAEMTYPGGGGGTQDRKIARLPGNSLGNLAIRAESAVPGWKGQIVRSQDRKTSGKLFKQPYDPGRTGPDRKMAPRVPRGSCDLAILRSGPAMGFPRTIHPEGMRCKSGDSVHAAGIANLCNIASNTPLGILQLAT